MFVATRGHRHGFSNPSGEQARVLGLWAPAEPALAFMRDIGAALAPDTPPDPDVCARSTPDTPAASCPDTAAPTARLSWPILGRRARPRSYP